MLTRLLFTLLCSYFIANLLITFLARPDIPIETPPFRVASTVAAPSRVVHESPSQPAAQSAQPCSTDIVGVVIGSEQAFVVARSGRLPVVSIERGQVTLTKNGKIEVCNIWNRTSLPSAEPEMVIAAERVAWAREHLAQLMTEARVVPAVISGKGSGFMIFSIVPGSLFQELGLKNGDVIKAVNGVEMSGPDKAIELYGRLAGMREVQLQVDRGGEIRRMTYAIR